MDSWPCIRIMTLVEILDKIEILGAIVGLTYLWLEYKANIWLWAAGVVMPLFYIYIFFAGKFYANACINVYYLFASIYGWFQWRKGATGESAEMRITSLPQQRRLPLAGIFAVLFALIVWILHSFTDSPVPLGDAFTTALSIIAMYLLAHKHLEQWLLWIVVNAVSAVLYFRQGLYPTCVLYAIYAAVSVAGFFKWQGMMKNYRESP
ncbi:MAG: nicotinamide riboside transporter PnuC [Tannerella sp.]|nr:nicotinamide riboside transporter PnuC [Tannerella sp.]